MPISLAQSTLDWSLNHVESFGDTDIYPVPFEFKPIREFWTRNPAYDSQRIEFSDWLCNQDLHNWRLRQARRYLSPKHQFGFRASLQLDPLDTLIYNGLVYEIGSDLEAARVSVSENIVHSYRFKPDVDGQMFDPNYGYESFHNECMSIACEQAVQWVVVADIADFYPRIYSHPLENALVVATRKTNHISVLTKLLSSLNHSVSYGIPVGPSGSRLLAEVVIADVDAALMSEGFRHTRFVDDYRIFCQSEREAYSALAFLANTLFENHGLTLQQHKTYIQPVEAFRTANADSASAQERKSLSEKFKDILEEIGLSSYEEIDFEDLPEELQEEINSMNLSGILEEQLTTVRSPDLMLLKFVLRRLSQINETDATDLVLENMKKLYPAFKEALVYLTSARNLENTDKHRLGNQILSFIDNEIIGHLEYHRAWIMSIFASDSDWNNADQFVTIFNNHSDSLTRREVILALGRARRFAWFKTRKRALGDFEAWQKRAFLYAASCLPGDEAKHWYRSIAPQLDELEKAVVDWARKNPISY